MKKIIIILLFSIPSFSFSQWTKVNGPYGGPVNLIKKTSQFLFAVPYGNGLFRSSDNGLNWEECNNGFTNLNVKDVTEIGSTIYAATYGAGIFKSTDAGNSWSSFNSPAIFTPFIEKIESINGKLVIGTYVGLFILQDNQWIDISGGIENPSIVDIKTNSGNLYVKTDWSRIYKSTNEGQNWIRLGPTPYTDYADLTIHRDYIFTLNFNGVYRCHKDSLVWVSLGRPFPPNYYPITVFSDSLNLYVSYQNSIYRSTNLGANFTQIANPSTNIFPGFKTLAFGSNLFIAHSEGIMFTSNGGVNWVSRNSNITNAVLNSINVYGEEMFCTLFGVVYKTTNSGNQWTIFFNGTLNNTPYPAISILRKNSTKVFIPVSNSYYTILRTSNNGVNWLNGLEAYNGFAYTGEINNEDAMFLAGHYLNVYHDDNTLNLTTYNLNSDGTNIYKSGEEFFISTVSNGIYRCSSNYDLTPINDGLPETKVNSVTSLDDYLFAATDNGVYKTNKTNIFWTRVFQSNDNIPYYKILTIGSRLILNSAGNIYKSTDYGNTWNSIFYTPVNNINSLWTNSEYLFASIGKNGLIRKAITDVIRIVPVNFAIPKTFLLKQNYPNPFNPATTINFQMPKNNFVSLKVYDINGREVSELVNENLQAGEYKINFDAHSLPSGVYYYKLATQNFSETKKMILVK